MKPTFLASIVAVALLGGASAWEFPPKWDGGYLGFYEHSKSKRWPAEAAKLVQVESENNKRAVDSNIRQRDTSGDAQPQR
ncbi:hypothetical protein UCRNP2_2083 [Neofusicoccum parvum UCRNP2]|uniref:Uncharacterized protein n=2 Tax=Neofusicoccum parvum TaxID=310453 RepID=R1GSA2_BOTPV|nr:hypothetical protein UCRNP2_2083 [Neofusicoccum parvum UCRNP2]GME25422.1 hypothetical protein GTA08_BOTSDO02457 [Neofusicoccum parvum]